VKRKSGRPTALELKPGSRGKYQPVRFPPQANQANATKPKRKGRGGGGGR
jgi:hypothetical protein